MRDYKCRYNFNFGFHVLIVNIYKYSLFLCAALKPSAFLNSFILGLLQSCHLQIGLVLLIPFWFVCHLFPYLAFLCWFEFAVLCCKARVRPDILAFLAPNLGGVTIQSFPTKYDISCWVLLNVHVEKMSLYSWVSYMSIEFSQIFFLHQLTW